MIFEDLNFIQFLILFLFFGTVNLIFIIREQKRYTRLSNGCYKNSGQDIVFLCGIRKEEVLHKLSIQTEEDTLYYDFYVQDNRYYINVKGVKRYNRNNILTVVFEIKFVNGKKDMYIVISLVKKWQSIYSGTYEVELYEFIINKIGAIPVKNVQ